VLQIATGTGKARLPQARSPTPRDPARVARVLRLLESSAAEPHSLADLAQVAGTSSYHFLRTFKAVTGSPRINGSCAHGCAPQRSALASDRRPVTEIALDVGFDDLSNFIRSFRAEFGLSPSRYRLLH
jgi:AraC-like DNA-binding protein